MTAVLLHYWAGARAAAGVVEEEFEAASVAEALSLARTRRQDPRFDRVLEVSTVLIDGIAAGEEALARLLTDPVRAEVLPPYAGGQETAPCSDCGRVSHFLDRG